LTEKKAGVLRLEDDEFVESGIFFRNDGHGCSIRRVGTGCKREDCGGREISGFRGGFPGLRNRAGW
jgi:hypothetical protein